MLWRGLTLRQTILDGLCILLCIASLICVFALYGDLPERIPMNYGFHGEITGYGSKASIFILLGVMYLMTATFSVLLRVKAFYRHMNIPWPVPWGKQPEVVSVTKEFMCWSNLCLTVGNAYLLYGCINGALNTLLVWVPYIALLALLIWYLLRLRQICLDL